MRYLLIIAVVLMSCNKDCATCEATITGENGTSYQYYYSQEDDGNCGMTMDRYEDTVTTQVEAEVELLTGLSIRQVLDSSGFITIDFVNHNYEITCSK